MTPNSREKILETAKRIAQARGYGGLSFRDLAAEVGIKAASIYHHFPSKADLAAAVARRYWEDMAAELATLTAAEPDPRARLACYPALFRRALENGNRICLASILSAEFDALPDPARAEIRTFADVNVAWLGEALSAAGAVAPEEAEPRAQAIYAAVAGAQLMARGRSDLMLFDAVIEGYRRSGLLPA